jgi:predicted Zn-dependent peptidase
MQTRAKLSFAVVAVLFAATTAAADTPAAKPIPAHPKELVYPPLEYQVPPASQFREVLSNGMVVYIAEDRMLPTFDMAVTIRTGGAFDPPDKAGLASLTGEQLRDGGTQALSPAELDERVEFLAASLYSSVADTEGTASLSLLSKDIDAGLELLIDILRRPRFDEERLRLAKERMLQNVKRRNDSTSSIERIEWGFLMDGDDHFSNRYPCSRTINAITREDLVAFHRRYYHPGNMIVAVAGDFDRPEMLRKLERAFADWPVGETAPATFPKPKHEPQPGIYVVDKEDVNQGRVSIGHKSVMRGTPDEFPLLVMNAILGGSGFQSRLVAKVRSEEGLAYSVGSRFQQGTYYPGDLRCYFQSKTNSCAYATKLVLDEIERLRREKVGQEELDNTLSLYAEFFPQRFPSKMAVLSTYVDDEYTGRDPDYWQTYVENLKRVTADDVLRVAGKYLDPDRLVILVVGETDALVAGGYDKAPDLRFDQFGKVTKLPLRDPDTLTR